MYKAYKFRIYPTPEQVSIIQMNFGCCRFIYNYFLEQRIDVYNTEKRSLSRYEQSRDLTKLKREPGFEWLKEADARALEASLKDLDEAYKNFYRRVKKGEKPGFPRFKSRHSNKKSYRSPNSGNSIRVISGNVRLPKIGFIKCRASQEIEGRILSATISQTPSGKYFVSICCTDVEIEQYESTGNKVGIDMGLHDFVVTSDGKRLENHKYFEKSYKKLARLHRSLSRKKKGSKNRDKARIRVARLYEKITNQRKDMHHKLSTNFVKQYDVICVEDLQVKSMAKNRMLSKAIQDASWNNFILNLEYKCNWRGKEFTKIDRFFPSSQFCGTCRYKNPVTKKLSVRKWKCPKCGTIHDRDVNAAKNILIEGLRILAI